MIKSSISVIVPAYNEEGNLESTIQKILKAINDGFSDYEVLIFDDGSSDRTGAIADALAAADPHIRVIHNGKNMGFGYNYRKGVELARLSYVALVPGDNEIHGDSIASIFAQTCKADIVAPYTVNRHVRPMSRQIISRSYTTFMNLLFGLELKYFNGPAVHRADLVKNVPITTYGFAFLSEIMVRLIRFGHSYIEVGMYLRPRDYGRSKAVKLKNVISVIKTILILAWSVYVRDRAQYNKRGQHLPEAALVTPEGVGGEL